MELLFTSADTKQLQGHSFQAVNLQMIIKAMFMAQKSLWWICLLFFIVESYKCHHLILTMTNKFPITSCKNCWLGFMLFVYSIDIDLYPHVS